MRAAFHTLGCKVNQYETEAMKEQFRAAGYEIVDEEESQEKQPVVEESHASTSAA